MSVFETPGGSSPTSADPGFLGATPSELEQASEAADRARDVLSREQSLLEAARGQDAAAAVEQQRRVDDAQRTLEAAEAFETALEDGNL